jgi:hypothetical protein
MKQTEKRLNRTAPYIVFCGDVLLFGIFAFWGGHVHQKDVSLVYVLLTAWPFWLSWLAIAPWSGLYSERIWQRLCAGVVRLTCVWIPAGLLAIAIRALFERSVPDIVFIGVTMGMMYVLLLCWRALMWAVWKWR